MKKSDTQLGLPQVVYTDTKVNIEALAGMVEGAHAYATDTDEPGWYDGAAWVWGAGGVTTVVRETTFSFAGNLVLTGAMSLLRFYNKLGITQTISEVFLSIDTPSAGADIIVDIHKNGVTIFTNQAHRPIIAAGANTGTTVLIDVDNWDDGDYLTAIIDQIGVGTVGANLTAHVIHS